jgi:hypothetical protein
MRKLYEATGGQPQRWESLGNLGATKADVAGIAYAVERGWLIISGGLHSVSLTEDGRRRMQASKAEAKERPEPIQARLTLPLTDNSGCAANAGLSARPCLQQGCQRK